MKLVCPACGAHASAEAWENDAEARRALDVARGLPKGALAYVGMFRKPGGGGVRWATARKRLQELAEMIKPGWIHIDKSTPARPAPLLIWRDAIARMLANPPRRLPLKNHNYLRQVVYDLADNQDREYEKKRTIAERAGKVKRTAEHQHRFGSGPMTPLGDLVAMQAEAIDARESNLQAGDRVKSYVDSLPDDQLQPLFERVLDAAPNKFTRKQLEKYAGYNGGRLRDVMASSVIAIQIIDDLNGV